MAFSAAIGKRLYATVLGAVREAGFGFDAIAAAQKLYGARGPAINSFLDYLNLTRSAERAWQAGMSLRGLGASNLRTRQHPIDPTLQGSSNRFRYRVVVYDMTGSGAAPYETLIMVDSPTPMSANDVIQQAIATAQAEHAAGTDSPRAKTKDQPTSWSAAIVSAGRQY